MTSRLCSQSHPEEEPGHGARKLIQAGPGNQLAEGSGHLWDEPPTFTNQCLLSCLLFFSPCTGSPSLLRSRRNSTPASSRERQRNVLSDPKGDAASAAGDPRGRKGARSSPALFQHLAEDSWAAPILPNAGSSALWFHFCLKTQWEFSLGCPSTRCSPVPFTRRSLRVFAGGKK